MKCQPALFLRRRADNSPSRMDDNWLATSPMKKKIRPLTMASMAPTLTPRLRSRMGVPHKIAPIPTSEYPTPAARPMNAALENRRLLARGLSVFRDWQEDLDEFVRLNREALLAEAAVLLKKD